MTKEFNKLTFIGRFQPFHNGHKRVIDKALELADEVVIIIGSSYQSRTLRNPFTFEEREHMIKSHYKDAPIYIRGVLDRPYSEHLWIASVKQAVASTEKFTPDPVRNGLIGHEKDSTSYYLDLFPTWDSVDVRSEDGINATDIRHVFYENGGPFLSSIVPKSTKDFLLEFRKNESFTYLLNEYNIIQKYKKAWEAAPYPPTFVTADAVVTQSEHILLVERKSHPGKGLLALPGGFVNQNEAIETAMIRELKEETKLKVPAPVIKGSIKKSKVFDSPNRSDRGRTITHAYHVDLGFGKLPKVKGSDDAAKAFWAPISSLDSRNMFEDHYHIIQWVL